MKIQYHNIKKRLRNYLILAIMWLIWGVVSLYLYNHNTISAYGFLVISFVYFSLFFYKKRYPYLTIENGLIYKDNIFSKKLALADIKTIDKVEGNYILKTDKAQISINPNLIDIDSLTELKSILKITE